MVLTLKSLSKRMRSGLKGRPSVGSISSRWTRLYPHPAVSCRRPGLRLQPCSPFKRLHRKNSFRTSIMGRPYKKTSAVWCAMVRTRRGLIRCAPFRAHRRPGLLRRDSAGAVSAHVAIGFTGHRHRQSRVMSVPGVLQLHLSISIAVL